MIIYKGVGRFLSCAGAFFTLMFLTTGFAGAEKKMSQSLNVYSARHYDSDRKLYKAFEDKTGIQIRLVEAGGDLLIEKIRADGSTSPADIIITVDAGRLWRAEQAGLFQPFVFEALEKKVPQNLRHPEGFWFGITRRARVLVYRKGVVDPSEVSSYEGLADPRWKGKICIRSSGNIYNQSLLASMIAEHGAEKAEQWARAVHDNLARRPRGGDTDQIRAVGAGVCDIAVVNHYYYARLAHSDKPADRALIEKVGLIWPNQDTRGVHINISGVGLAKGAPNPEAAKAFLEFLLSDEAQLILAEGNREYPVVGTVVYTDPVLTELGKFKVDPLNVARYGQYQREAQIIFDKVRWP